MNKEKNNPQRTLIHEGARRKEIRKTLCNFVNLVDRYVLVFLVLFLSIFISVDSSAHAFTATTIGDYGNVTVMETAGNYDARKS